MTPLETTRTAQVQAFRSLSLGPDSWLCVLVKEAHLLRGRPKAEQPRALAIMRERRYQGELMVEESELTAAARESCDVFLSGSAYPGAEASFADTSLTVGSLARSVRVHGARRIEFSGGSLAYSNAEPFERASLSKANAYGGSLPRPRAKRGAFGANARAGVPEDEAFYPRNAAGRGFCSEATAQLLNGRLAPSQEDPYDPVLPERLAVSDVRAWLDAPIAADYGPVDLFEFPRAQFLHPYVVPKDTQPLEARRGWLGAPSTAWSRGDVDPRAASAAAPGLCGAVSVGDRCVARNLFPGGGEVAFRVPGGPRAVEVALPGAGRYGAALELRTLHLRPDEGLLELTWAARIPVFFEYPSEMLAGLKADVRD
jgi:hypothetical protein